MKISCIFSLTFTKEDGVFAFGDNGQLVSMTLKDLQNFKKHTVGNAIIMGKGTFVSMGSAPLPDRDSIVITSDESLISKHKNLHFVRSLNEAIEFADEELEVDTAFVIGGSELINTVLYGIADGAIITYFMTNVRETDAVFYKEYDPDMVSVKYESYNEMCTILGIDKRCQFVIQTLERRPLNNE